MSAVLLSFFTIVGTWQYAGFRYNGDEYPNPNPNLILRFTFNADNTNHLIWYRTNEPGFCERKGEYRLKGDLLWQKTTWINPQNDRPCSDDPDMQLNRETNTRILLGESELAFVLNLDGSDFFYLLRPVQSVSQYGTGLSISKNAIQKHNGTLFLDPRSERTRFVMRLPKSQKRGGGTN